ncbi:glycosyltransferase family 4 protein [Patescibacteria group bacterium]|nr:glycosyltransferase family 4 protein [Patescibacteria group bacterium]
MFLTTLGGLQKKTEMEHIGCIISNRLDLLSTNVQRLITLNLPRSDCYPLRALLDVYQFPFLLLTTLRENPDILYVYHNTDDKFIVTLIGKILKKKVVLRKNNQKRYLPIISHFIAPINYFLCDKIVTIFKEGNDELKASNVPSEKIIYIPNGKNISNYKSNLNKKQAKIKLGLNGNEFVLGIISRLDPIKNHEAVIRVLPELLKLRKNLKFVIVGGPPSNFYKKKLQKLVKELGLEENILFLVYGKDIPDTLPAFDIFVHPSLTDALPGAVLEAMCAGLSIVASDVGGTKELLGDCGILISPTDQKGLTEAIVKLMNDPKLRKEYGKKAQQRAESEFSEEKMIDSYEKLFIQLTNEK